MANNATDHRANYTQPALSLACSWIGIFVWKEEHLTPTTFTMLVVVVCAAVPMCLLTTSLNVLVILAVWRKHYLRKQKPCVLLACLAATDLLVGAVVLPLVISSHIMRLAGQGPVCLLDLIVMESAFVACGASLFHLVIISGERYVAIKHALRYETLVTTRRLTIAVAAAWAIPVVLTTTAHIEADDPAFHIVVVLACVPGSVAAICFFQAVVFLESRRHRKHIRAHQVSETTAREILKKDKAAITTTMIVGALCLCYAPPTVYYGILMEEKIIASGSMYLMDLFVYFNALINPVMYCVRTQDFKRAFREILNLGNPQGNPGLEMHRVGNFARQQRNSKAQIEPPQNETGTAWLQNTRRPRETRTRSFALSTNSSQVQRRRRNNSI